MKHFDLGKNIGTRNTVFVGTDVCEDVRKAFVSAPEELITCMGIRFVHNPHLPPNTIATCDPRLAASLRQVLSKDLMWC